MKLYKTYSTLFTQLSRDSDETLFGKILSNAFDTKSRLFDQTSIQESSSFRASYIGRALACELIGDDGKFLFKKCQQAIAVLQENLYSLGPKRHLDDPKREFILATLQKFCSDTSLQKALHRISAPTTHPIAQKVVRETLGLSAKVSLKDVDARRAALSALLTPLRQNVGSCFATAPAILIQRESPSLFLKDIAELLATGQLKRVFDGHEHQAPISASFGVGDLYRPFVLFSIRKRPVEALASSPGLIAAFESASIFKEKISLEQKRLQLQMLLEKSMGLNESSEGFSVHSPDSIIQQALLHYYNLTSEDLTTYQSRPSTTLLSALINRPPASSRGKSHFCREYLASYERAKAAFRSVTDNPLLKMWEFTLASFAETKTTFGTWNLYQSLGLNAEEPEGLGHAFYEIISTLIDRANKEIEEAQALYDQLFANAQTLEGRSRTITSERDMNWLQSEYQMRRLEMNRAVVMRDEAYERGSKLRELFPFLLNFYSEKFKDYFQEVYDADVRQVKASLYDDSPAGFRLLYKHGRTNTALWTLIHNPSEYVQSLTAFFNATEVELSHKDETKLVDRELTDLVTAAITLIKRPEFLESSFYRLSKAYQEPVVKEPLSHLDSLTRTPWSYISGGTMTTLVQHYFSLPDKPKETSRWIENERELLAFYIDTLKELPLNTQKQLKNDRKKGLLAFSPTHAFLLRPGYKRFQEAWESDLYTYSWIRDQFEVDGKKFLSDTLLSIRMMEHLVDLIADTLPQGYAPIFKQGVLPFSYPMFPANFREHVVQALSYQRWATSSLSHLSEQLDCILYEQLPLFPEYALKEHLSTLFGQIEEVDRTFFASLMDHFESLEEEIPRYTILGAKDLRMIAKLLLMKAFNKTHMPISWHQKIQQAMQKTKLAYPEPLLFADTNWINNVFGFLVGPGSEELELWRFDPTAVTGQPMHSWKEYLDGTSKLTWGLYTSPSQYSV